MKTVIQRASKASVLINNSSRQSIGKGLVVLVGFEATDTVADIEWMVRKIMQLRIFDDTNGVMNLSLTEIGGELLVISQFTLHASTKKGNRPSYIKAAKPEISVPLYNIFLKLLSGKSAHQVKCGEFGAHMDVELINDGPVTIIIDSKNKV